MKVFIDTNVYLGGILGLGLCKVLLKTLLDGNHGLLLGERVHAEFLRIAVTKFRASHERPRAGLRPARPPRGSRKLGAARHFLESSLRLLKIFL
ncbi:MAG: hypothetical protein RBR52_14460 [Thiomonas sp.]|uniref:hypothetical protein n=1 Tax=Thiomonas sp. TaxID=2047785 RepID=UPI002A35F6BF|nr:hypothetical protein [Thiomonas sp.]MDY0331677.1 hypothetical protein [Thiomonas sp.]